MKPMFANQNERPRRLSDIYVVIRYITPRRKKTADRASERGLDTYDVYFRRRPRRGISTGIWASHPHPTRKVRFLFNSSRATKAVHQTVTVLLVDPLANTDKGVIEEEEEEEEEDEEAGPCS